MTTQTFEKNNTTTNQQTEKILSNQPQNNEDLVPSVVHFSCKKCNIHISDTMWYYRSTPVMVAVDGMFINYFEEFQKRKSLKSANTDNPLIK
jgi:hypothetical protein